MSKKELLIEKIREHSGVITTKQAIEYGIHKDLLKNMVIKEELEKIANGLYGLPGESIDEYLYFTHRVPKGIFSHETAAYLHGLTTRIPFSYVMTVAVGDNVSRVKSVKSNILFKYVNKEIYNTGKITSLSPFGREILLYDKERTILDLIKDKNRVDTQVFTESIKIYFSSKDKNILRLSTYAIQLGMENELRAYTEVLLWKHQNKSKEQ